MGGTILVRLPIDEGRKLVDALEDSGIPLKAAFWLYFDEADVWRLVVASPLVDKEGPLRVYERIQEVLKKLAETIPIQLSEISAFSPNDGIVKPLRIALDKRDNSEVLHVKSGIITGGKTSVY